MDTVTRRRGNIDGDYMLMPMKTYTLSPFLKLSTPSPTSSTSPEESVPITAGYSTKKPFFWIFQSIWLSAIVVISNQFSTDVWTTYPLHGSLPVLLLYPISGSDVRWLSKDLVWMRWREPFAYLSSWRCERDDGSISLVDMVESFTARTGWYFNRFLSFEIIYNFLLISEREK